MTKINQYNNIGNKHGFWINEISNNIKYTINYDNGIKSGYVEDNYVILSIIIKYFYINNHIKLMEDYYNIEYII